MSCNTKLENLVDHFKKHLSYYKQKNIENPYNEHSCRTEYIEPLLEILGWDVSNSQGLAPQYREVIAENYSTNTDSNDPLKFRPDYSLTLRGVTKLFVEAKKPSVDILEDSDSALQIRKYGWNAGHKIAILTNFEYFVIYDTTYVPKKGERSTVARHKCYHYLDYFKSIDEIGNLVSKDAVYSGNFDAFTNKEFPIGNNGTQQVDKYFLTQINNWRVALSNELYSKGGRYKSIEVLNDVVQDFINQIVFLRICEDKNLPVYHHLKETVANKAQLHRKLEELFRKADNRYNSGLFSGNNIIFDLNSKVIKEMIEGLYYPQSPYLFNIIEPNMLGKIYEVFLTEQLTCVDNKISLARKKDCINKTIVTTPTEIVKYIVEKTLKPLCEGLSPDRIKELRIADIACGSGIFLEEVFSFIQSKCVDWYKNNNPEHLEKIDGNRWKLPLQEKKELLTSCVYGIDIDIHAVEATKFSLLIKLIEDETAPSVVDSKPILPDLSSNIFHGNSLVSKKEIGNLSISNEDLFAMVPFNWEKMGVINGFDAIVGNPPYENTEDMHAHLPEIEFSIYTNKKNYKSSYKQFDKYFIFLERAINKVKNNGYVCFIIPNRFYKIVAGENLRQLISEKKMLVRLDDFGDEQLFEDKTIYSSILLLQKKEQDSFVFSNVKTSSSLWIGEKVNSIEMLSDTLNKLPWRLSTDFDFLRMMRKLDDVSVPLSKYANIINGIQTSAERPNPIYWFSSDMIQDETDEYFVILKDGHKYRIEKSILRPYFKPSKQKEKGLNSYSSLKTDKMIIFPYDKKGQLFDIEVMKKYYPGTFKYLKANYNRLVPKSVSKKGIRDVKDATKDTWYQYGRNQGLTAFTNTPKLIVGILSKEPMYAYDRANMLISSGGTAGYCAISVKRGSRYKLEYLQAWLSNPYTEKLLKIIGCDFEGGFTSRGTSVLSILPFVELDFKNPTQKSIYDRVVVCSQEIYKINKKLDKKTLTKSDKDFYLSQKEELIQEIEGLIGRVYRLEF